MLDVVQCYSLDSISFIRYEQESMDFWITFAKIFKVREYIFCVATRERVWDVPVLASHIMNANSICSTLGHNVKNRISQI